MPPRCWVRSFALRRFGSVLSSLSPLFPHSWRFFLRSFILFLCPPSLFSLPLWLVLWVGVFVSHLPCVFPLTFGFSFFSRQCHRVRMFTFTLLPLGGVRLSIFFTARFFGFFRSWLLVLPEPTSPSCKSLRFAQRPSGLAFPARRSHILFRLRVVFNRTTTPGSPYCECAGGLRPHSCGFCSLQNGGLCGYCASS